MTYEKIEGFYYFFGDTYPRKEELKDSGCHYDPRRRIWWTEDEATAARLCEAPAAPPCGAFTEDQIRRARRAQARNDREQGIHGMDPSRHEREWRSMSRAELAEEIVRLETEF